MMNQEGFGSNGSAYEYTISIKGARRTLCRLALLALYFFWIVLFFTIGILSRLLLPLLCFVPLSLWILVFLTWRFSQKEIKLSFLAGVMTVTRQYDGKNKKILAEVRIKNLDVVKPYEDDDIQEKNLILATSSGKPDGAYLATWQDRALIFEANEKALKILKYYHGV